MKTNEERKTARAYTLAVTIIISVMLMLCGFITAKHKAEYMYYGKEIETVRFTLSALLST